MLSLLFLLLAHDMEVVDDDNVANSCASTCDLTQVHVDAPCAWWQQFQRARDAHIGPEVAPSAEVAEALQTLFGGS